MRLDPLNFELPLDQLKMQCPWKINVKASWAWVLVNFFCVSVLGFQLVHLCIEYIKPSITITQEKMVNLEDIEFPIVIKICIIPGFDEAAIRDAGYSESWYYFYGQSKFNGSIFGWAGHNNQSETLGEVAEIFKRVRNGQVVDLLKRVRIRNDKGIFTDIPLEYVKQKRVNYPNNCQTLDLLEVTEIKGTIKKQIWIEFENLTDRSVEIIIKGRNLDCGRDIKDHSFYSTGQTIKVDKNLLWKSYMVEISQRVYVEEGPSKRCKNYPTAEFSSYKDCDDSFVSGIITREVPGLVPIWQNDNLEKVSTRVFDENFKMGQINMDHLIDGTLLPDCPLPCQTTHTHTKFLSTHEAAKTVLDITFSSEVMVTTTNMLGPTFSSFLSEVGGSMGLWLGLGVVQLLQLVVTCSTVFKNAKGRNTQQI